jgi:hypothetical protein
MCNLLADWELAPVPDAVLKPVNTLEEDEDPVPADALASLKRVMSPDDD